MSFAQRPVLVIKQDSVEEFQSHCATLFNMDYEIKAAGTYIRGVQRVWWAVLSHRRKT